MNDSQNHKDKIKIIDFWDYANIDIIISMYWYMHFYILFCFFLNKDLKRLLIIFLGRLDFLKKNKYGIILSL